MACGGYLEVGPGQLGRRNLNDMQRAQLALQLEDVVRARAKERQATSGPGALGAKPLQANLPEAVGRQSRDELAAQGENRFRQICRNLLAKERQGTRTDLQANLPEGVGRQSRDELAAETW
ncbi:hypothetical protein [Desulfarculus baarsii]|uniref:hypothetical protein n=1 Tax=Desulfarculus baarsii TaxID=453230 RepID=UPI0016510000|nr:hypothetical protein [Desulfarculus baarsii]